MRRRNLVILSLLVFLIVGCSNRNLDRKRAAQIIADLDRFKGDAHFAIATDSPFMRESIPLSCRTQAELERHPVNVWLVKLGWVRYETRLTSVGYQRQSDCPVMMLTEAGKTASAQWQSRPAPYDKGTVWTIPIGQRELLEVTGLTGAPDGSTVAEYTWKWRPNQVGDTLERSVEQARAFFQKTRKGSAACRLWDDGWRCTLTHMSTGFDDIGEFSVPYTDNRLTGVVPLPG